MAYVITAACIDIKDKLCLDQCPVECIYEGDRMLYIHPDECIDCGACEPVCPQGAIARDDELQPDLIGFAGINRDFSEQIDEDDASSDTTYPDHPHVRAFSAASSDG